MLIDEKGKLFGKLNILDAVILLAIIAALAFAGYKMLGSDSRGTTNSKITVVFFGEEVPDFAAESVKVGDVVSDESKGAYLGKVTKIEIGDSVSYNPNAQGEIVKSSKDGYRSMIITTELEKGTMFENGLIIDGNKYGVGHSMTIRAGIGKIFVRVAGIEAVN